MSEALPKTSPAWALLAIIAVEKADRVQCQCKNCGQAVYAAIHIILLPTGEIQCWGCDCYAREAGSVPGPRPAPLYPGVNGRKLTDAERELLRTNRDRLIAQFKADHEEKLRAQEARQAEEGRKAESQVQTNVKLAEDSMSAAVDVAAGFSLPAPVSRQPVPTYILPPVDHTKPRADEPMDDPRYREIRDRKVQDWLRDGIDLNKAYHYNRLIENCLHDYYRLGYGRDRSRL